MFKIQKHVGKVRKDIHEFAKTVRLNLQIKVRKIPAGGGDGGTVVW